MLLDSSNPDVYAQLVRVLRAGEVAIMACDTIYGLVGIVPQSEHKIRTIKGRAQEKPFLQLIASDWVATYSDTAIPDGLRDLWPGPLTLILPTPDGRKTAFRVPADPLLSRILAAIGKPLFSTSVNRSGQQSLWRIKDIVSLFESQTALIIDSGDLEGRLPSTIVDLSSRPFRLVRQGALEISEGLLT